MYGHHAVSSLAALGGVISVLRGERSVELSPDDVRIVLHTEYWFSQLTDADAEVVGSLKELQSIALSASPLGAAGMKSLADLPRLTSKTTDEGVRALAAAGRLERVRLAQAKITDDSLRALSGCTRLRALDVSRCSKVTDEGVGALSACAELEELHLSGTKLTGRGLSALSALTNLRTLHVQSQKLTAKDVPALASIRSLKRVMLGRNEFTGAGFAALKRALPECDINTLR